MLEEGRGPRVPRSKGSKVQGSQGPRYLKLKFKYELVSKEGPSCLVNVFKILYFKIETGQCNVLFLQKFSLCCYLNILWLFPWTKSLIIHCQTFCIITHCGWETTQCVLDPKCWEVLTCLQVIKMEFNFSVFKSTYFQVSIKWVKMNKWGKINFSSNFNKWVGTFI